MRWPLLALIGVFTVVAAAAFWLTARKDPIGDGKFETIRAGMTPTKVESVLGRKHDLSRGGRPEVRIWKYPAGDLFVGFDKSDSEVLAMGTVFRWTAPESLLEKAKRWLGFASPVRARWYF